MYLYSINTIPFSNIPQIMSKKHQQRCEECFCDRVLVQLISYLNQMLLWFWEAAVDKQRTKVPKVSGGELPLKEKQNSKSVTSFMSVPVGISTTPLDKLPLELMNELIRCWWSEVKDRGHWDLTSVLPMSTLEALEVFSFLLVQTPSWMNRSEYESGQMFM